MQNLSAVTSPAREDFHRQALPDAARKAGVSEISVIHSLSPCPKKERLLSMEDFGTEPHLLVTAGTRSAAGL
ncbi:MAG: hypothetical protein AB1500_02385 [Bacillota bacterium]